MALHRSSLYFALLSVLVGGLTSAFAAPVTVSFQDGVSGYTGTRDTTLASATPTINSGTNAKLSVDGSPDLSCLISWDMTSIPVGSVIRSVDVVVNVTNTSSQIYEFYQMLRPWVETEATWNQYRAGQGWQTAGADGPADRGSTVLGGISAASAGLSVIALNAAGVSVVQSWVDNPAMNLGFIIMDYINNSNGLDFSSRETATISNRPKLIVTYERNSQPTLSINDVVVTEGDAGSVDATFTISLSPSAAVNVTVDYATADNSATTADNDYRPVSGQMTFLPGETSHTVTVAVNGDLKVEGNETFFVNLGNAVNAAIGKNQGIGTISDNDEPLRPDIAANPMSHDFGYLVQNTSSTHVFAVSNEGTADLYVTSVTLTGPDVGDFHIESGSGSFVLAPGSVHNIAVSFTPTKSGTMNASLLIMSDDPDESILNISLSGKGLSGTLPGEPITFTVTGDYPDGTGEMSILEQHVTEHNLYSPSDFFAHVGDLVAPSEGCTEPSYQAVAAVLKTLAVPAFVVIGDNDWIDCSNRTLAHQYWWNTFCYFEDHFCGSLLVERQSIRPENWAFVLKGVLFVGVSIPEGSAYSGERTVRLQDDANWVADQFQDKASRVRAAVVFGHRGPGSSYDLFFNELVTASVGFAKPVLYIQGHNHHYLLDHPWNAPNMQRMIVTRGAEEDPAQITVTMDMDNPFDIKREPWRTNPPPPLFNRKPCVEAGADQVISQTDTLHLDGWATDDGVPTNPGHLTTTWSRLEGPGTVSFGDPHALNTSASFSSAGFYRLLLSAYDGELTGSDEMSVEVKPSGPGPVVPNLSINDAVVTEGNVGTVNAVFTVTLSAVASESVTVDYATADDTATTADSDYIPTSGQLTFLPGEISKQIVVTVNGDLKLEPDETFHVNLSNAHNAVIVDDQGLGTIRNDDGAQAPVMVSFQDGAAGYIGTRDTKLLSSAPDSNFGSDPTLELDGSPDASTLMYWDLTSIRPGSFITAVDITINVTNSSNHVFNFFEALRNWVEGEATWNNYASGQSWQLAGGDGPGDRGSTVLASVSGSKGLKTISINPAGVAVVQSWVDSPASNHGFIVLNYVGASDGLDFSSRENRTVANRPKLTVTYTAASQSGGN